jgi:type VI secretion system protein ImpF
VAFQLDVQVTLSVLDRLIDNDPRSADEAVPTRAETVRKLRAAVRRDIEWLLNSRRIAVPPDEELRELNQSAYVYGLPDLSTVSLANINDRASLLGAIERSIKLFEPRLADVRVVPVEDPAQKTIQRLDFRIEAMLLMDPSPEHVSFDTTVDGVSQSYKVRAEGVE